MILKHFLIPRLNTLGMTRMLLLFVVVITLAFINGLTLQEHFETKPFVTIWNAPSLKCEKRFGINLNLSYFDIVANSGDYFEGDEVVIFYKTKLGLYPWIQEDGMFVNGGLPQVSVSYTWIMPSISLDYVCEQLLFMGCLRNNEKSG